MVEEGAIGRGAAAGAAADAVGAGAAAAFIGASVAGAVTGVLLQADNSTTGRPERPERTWGWWTWRGSLRNLQCCRPMLRLTSRCHRLALGHRVNTFSPIYQRNSRRRPFTQGAVARTIHRRRLLQGSKARARAASPFLEALPGRTGLDWPGLRDRFAASASGQALRRTPARH